MLSNGLPPSSGAQIPARSGETGHVDIAINLAELDPGRPGPRAAVVLDAVAVSSHSRETRGLSRAYPGGSTVGTTCTAYSWPLTASSWSTATPRSNLAALRKGLFFCARTSCFFPLIIGWRVILWLLGLDRTSSCKSSSSQITTTPILSRLLTRTLNESNSF